VRRTIGTQLIAIAVVAATALALILILGTVVDSRVTSQIQTIRTKFIPKLGLANELETTFEKISRQLRDAADASDPELIALAGEQKVRVLEKLASASEVIDRAEGEAARAAVDAYYTRAESVTRRMIKGESGDALIKDTEAMQRDQAQASQLLARAARVDEAALTTQFESVVDAQRRGARDRLIVSAFGLVLAIGLTLWISRRLYRGLGALAQGFQRFGQGDFDTPIKVTSDDELGSVARDANYMAERLRKLARERDDSDWLKAGQVGLAEELRGELDPDEVAQRAIKYLARYLGAPLGMIYVADRDKVLRPFAGHGVTIEGKPSFAFGDGIVGQAATQAEVTVLAAPKGKLPIRSGLTDGEPTSIVLVPLLLSGQVIGIAELAVLEVWTPVKNELALGSRDTIAIALEVARAREATRTLLAESQRQAAELLSARRGIEQKADELSRASTFKSQFLANMSHELRTPLNAIIGFSELMVDGAIPRDSEQAKEFLEDILTSGRHLLQLINDVLDLSKVEAGRLEFVLRATRFSTVLKEVLAILRTVTVKKRIQIETAIEEDIDEVTLDPARLKQVLYNYLSNAIKFTPDGGRVAVRARAAALPGRFRIEVEDTGPGIDAADLEKLFVEFQQTTAGVDHGSGTGLGLALTKRLVEAQGGNVGVSSMVGRGSVFFAVLPRVAGPATVPMVRTTIDPSGKPTILVVEDDPKDRDHLVNALERAGYAVEAVGTGAEAIDRLRTKIYDAITLDLLLPDITGIEVLQQLRNTPNSNVPVVLITIVAEKGAVAGFAVHDILPKPLDDRALVASLDRAKVTANTADPAVLVVDDDATSLKMISATLSKLGYNAVCEQDSVVGLERAIALRPSAIILDLIMPKLSGFEFLDQLRRDPAGRAVPVIVWTSKDLTVDERAALRRSADVVVTKGQDGNARVVSELAMMIPANRTGTAA
jgi:signal transduction histidine kinase/CheY-like chemotaxis protein/HAMP domain-containing protein